MKSFSSIKISNCLIATKMMTYLALRSMRLLEYFEIFLQEFWEIDAFEYNLKYEYYISVYQKTLEKHHVTICFENETHKNIAPDGGNWTEIDFSQLKLKW